MEETSTTISTDVEKDGFIQRFIDACGTSEPADIQRKLGIPYQSAKNYLEGRLPAPNALLLINEKTGISIHWLLTGEGPKRINRIDFKNLWARIVQAWERAYRADRSLKSEVEMAKDMGTRNFLPDFKLVQRVSNITNTPVLWLLTGEGLSQSEKPFENAPAYLADLIVDYKAKEELTLPLKNKLMSTEIRNGDYVSDQLEKSDNETGINAFKIPFSEAELTILNKLAGENRLTVEEKIREIIASHLLGQGAITLREILVTEKEAEAKTSKGLQMTNKIARTDTENGSHKERA